MEKKKVRMAYGIWADERDVKRARIAVAVALALFFAASFGPETLRMLGWL